MSSTQEKLEEILVGLFQSGYIGSFEYGQVQLVEYRDKILNQAKKDIVALIDSAKREGFLEGQLESLGKVTKENFMYRCLYGELPLDYKGVDLLEAYKSYRENDSFRENFARYVEQVAVELEQSEESE